MRFRLSTLTIIALILAGCSLNREPAGSSITIEVAVFEGGYGIDWHKSVARQYESLHPGIHINLWGDPRVDEKLKPRILRNDPPEIANSTLPVWKLIVAGKLYPLDEELATQAYGQTCTWRESLTPGVLADYTYQGHAYAMPTNLSAWVCWYDRRQFRQHGWEAPRSWIEFTALCDKMKAAGIAPLAFQGKYPDYGWPTLLSIYQRLVPMEKWYEIEDLKPGAFLDPEFIHAATMMQQMGVKYFQNGSAAMTHTESQMEWVNGRAAMVFCGLWLKNEMKNAIPPGFEMACFAVPPIEGGHGDPNAIYGGGGENCFVFKNSKHPKEALDFLKYMVSLQSARTYCQRLDTLAPVKNAVKGVSISPALQSAVDVMDRSSRIYSDKLQNLYLEFGKTIMPVTLSALMTGKITPEQFAHKLEDSVQAVREDSDVYKPAPMGVPNLQ